MLRAWGWVRRFPRQIGRVVILLGIILAGFFSNHGFLPQPEGSWRDIRVASVERESLPRRGRVEKSYRLMLDGDARIVQIDSDISALFNQHLLLGRTLPAPVEVLSDAEPESTVIRAQGLRLKDGSLLLDPEQVHRIRQPGEFIGVAICSAFVVLGIAMHFLKAQKVRA